MTEKVLLFRFSLDGFTPQYQQFHAEGLELGLKKFKEHPSDYPIHLIKNVEEHYSKILPEWKEFTNGVFTFAGSLPDKDTLRILLNHLHKTQKEQYSWWTAEIDENQYCFDVNNCNLWTSSGFMKIKDMIAKSNYEMFIPEQFLKVENVQQWGNDHRSIFIQSNKKFKL
jgi:hypothetical protein